MSLTRYEISMTDGSKSVRGEPIGDHLAAREHGGRCVIDHIPSGRSVCTLMAIEVARIVGESIKDLADWSVESPTPPKEVLDYIRQAHGKHRVSPIGEPPPVPPTARVDIEVEYSISLSVRDMWPDGDWPDDVTEESVLRAIEAAGGFDGAVRDWCFDRDHRISVRK